MIACFVLLLDPIMPKPSSSFELDMSEFLNVPNNDVILHSQKTSKEQSSKASFQMKQKRVLVTPPPDPCQEYEDGAAKQMCKICKPTYELILFNQTKTICGKMSVDATGDEVCTIDQNEYPGEYDFFTKVKTNLHVDNEQRLMYFRQPPGTAYKNYCLNTQLYYLRWKANCHKTTPPTFTVSKLTASFCPQIYPSFQNSSEDALVAGISMMDNMTCYRCSVGDALYSDAKMKWYDQLGIFGAQCIPQYPYYNCTTPSPTPPSFRPYCEVTAIYNNQTKRCQYCSETMPRCSYCENYKDCILCRRNLFWNQNGTYQYLPNITDVNTQRRRECMFDKCGQGFCQNYQTRRCDPIFPTLTNCLKCISQTVNNTNNQNTQFCQICEKGYIQSADRKSCLKLPAVDQKFIYYVKAAEKLLFRYKSFTLPHLDNSTILQCARSYEDSDLFVNIDPSNINKAAPMLQVALRKLYMNENITSNVTATIYIAKGIHYFITCRGDESTMYGVAKHIFKYCEEYDLYRYNYDAHDNWDITIQAMECQFGKALGLESNAQFLSTCVDFQKGDPKPTIYVNDIWTGFNITGKMTIKNLKFSGLQMFVNQTTDTKVQFNLFPQSYCKLNGGEPRRNIDNIEMDNLTSCMNLIYNYTHNCQLDYRASIPQKSTFDADTCDQNGQKVFYPFYRGSLRCKGEMANDGDYFNIYETGKSLTYSKRRKSLFNLYSFADHKTMKKEPTPPELVIENSDFEYFLKNNIESLIFIESMTASSVRLTESAVVQGTTAITSIIYQIYNGADRGAKILIQGSTFKHSLFCKGMIVYRNSHLDGIERNPQQLNLTNMYMENPLRNQTGSQILIKDSTFKNLNAFRDTEALAITGPSRKWFRSCNLICPILPAFYNKGIIMTLEDFGGRVEVVSSNFENNAHYIPDILYRGDSQSPLESISAFRDSSTTAELHFRICNNETQESKYFFGQSVEMAQGQSSTDIETFFEQYERLGLIYISRIKEVVIIKDNTFKNNIGTFGGAITINSPNWIEGKQPHILIKKNIFISNMAYFSGNAIYIRNLINKNQVNSNYVCGGATIVDNYFKNNIGMKVHNGGAITARCEINEIGSTHQDYGSSAAINLKYKFTSSSGFQNESVITVSSILDQSVNYIQKFKFTVQDNIFEENFSGGKGSAIYISQMSQPRLVRNSFLGNGPVYAQMEFLYSPYFSLYSDRSITYYDENCIDEFSFLQDCNNKEQIYSDYLTSEIQFSNVQGAVYVSFCETSFCINNNIVAELEINECQFLKNLAGPILHYQSSNSVSQLYIQGGQSMIIVNTDFSNNAGSPYFFQDMSPFAMFPNKRYLINYFPKDYFSLSHSPMIKIIQNPPPKNLLDYNFFNFTFRDCRFQNNKNTEVVALDSSDYQAQKGSLITASFGGKTDFYQNVDINLIIEDCLFTDNFYVGNVGALIYSNNIQTSLFRNKFVNNGRLKEIITKRSNYDSQLYISSSQFTFNSYQYIETQYHGCLYLQGDLIIIAKEKAIAYPTQHQLINNTFKYIFSKKASAYHLQEIAQDVYIFGNSYSYIFAHEKGSILYWKNSYQQISVFMEQEVGEFLFGGIQGAIVAIPIPENLVRMFIFNSTFNHAYAQSEQIMSLLDLNKFMAKQVNFYRSPNLQMVQIKSIIISSFKKNNQDLFQLIQPEIFESMTVQLNQKFGAISLIGVYDIADLQNVTYKGKLILSSTDPFYRYAQFINCNFIGLYAEKAPAILSEFTYLAVINNQKGVYFIANNSATLGNDGAISIQRETQFIFQNLTFFNNTAEKASAVYIDESLGNMTNVDFKKHLAKSAGTIVIESDSTVNFTNCLFEQNRAKESSAIFLQNNLKTITQINNSTLINNNAGQNLMNGFFSSIIIQNCQMFDNIAEQVNHGISLLSSKAEIINLTINYTIPSFVRNNDFQVDSGFFILTSMSEMIIRSSRIFNCRGGNSAVLTYMGRSKVSILNGTLIQGCLAKKGPVILSSLSQMLEIDSSTFKNNGQSDIMLTETDAKITNSFFLTTLKSSIKIAAQFIHIENTTFEDNSMKYFDQSRGSGLQIDGISIINLINNTFKTLKAVQGGAIYIDSTYTNLNDLHSQYLIERNKFIKNEAQHGGAIYIQNGKNVILKSNIFDSNKALVINPPTEDSVGLSPKKGLGGAIYLNCGSYNLLKNPNACNVTLQDKNIFKNNSAENDGGAFLWSKQKPIIDKNTQYQNNTAYYGSNFASYPKSVNIKFITKSNQVNSTLRFLQSVSSQSYQENFPSLVSGGSFDIDIEILDQEGKIYKTDNQSKALITIENATVDQSVKNNEVVAVKGIYKFRNLMIISKPGTNPKLEISFQGIETFGNQIDFSSNNVYLPVNVRNCSMGEELTVDNRCVPCEKHMYLLEAPTKQTSCKECPQNAICYGLNLMTPVAGYWRSSNISINFIQCPNKDACLKGNQSVPIGQCEKGYQGILCGDCDENYSKSKQFECSQCPDKTRNLIQTIFISIGACIYVTILVRSSMASAHQNKSLHSVYIKILTNHFQMLGAISNIEYHWPQAIQDFQQQQSTVSQVTDQVFSFDCFLMGSDLKDDGIPVFFQKLIMFGILPIVVLIILIIFWLVVSRFEKKPVIEYVGKFMSSLIVVLFLVHPNIANSMFLAFNCIEVDGVYRMKEDIKNICYEGIHLKYISLLVFPAVGLWVFGIPLLAFFILYKNKDTILLMNRKEITQAQADEILNFKMKYGFLLSGYGPLTFGWETVIMFRKVFLIGASVFLSTVSTEAQVLLVILIIVLNLFLQINYNPYFSPSLNRMENYSLQVSAITIYIGMFYVTGRHYQYMKRDWLSWFFLVIIVLPNLIFISYWVHLMRIEILKMAHKKNIKSIIFKIIACKDPEKFYSQYIQPEELLAKEQEQVIVDEIKAQYQSAKDKEKANDDDVVCPESIQLEDKNNDSIMKTNIQDNSMNTLVTDINKRSQSRSRLRKRMQAYLEPIETFGYVSNRSKVHPDEEVHPQQKEQSVVSLYRTQHQRQQSAQQLIQNQDSHLQKFDTSFEEIGITARQSSKKKKKKKRKKVKSSSHRQHEAKARQEDEDEGDQIDEIHITSDFESPITTERRKTSRKQQKTLNIQIDDY